MNKVERNTTGRNLRLVFIVLTLVTVACSFQGCGKDEPPLTPGVEPSPTVDVASLPPTSPKIIAQRPYPGEELPLSGSIDVYFDQPMDKLSVENALKISPAVEADLVWINETTLRITPKSGQLNRATRYTITFDKSATASNGLSFADTVNVPVQTVGYLEVSEVVPAPDITSVETDAVITVFFNRPVVPLTLIGQQAELPDPVTFSPAIPGQGEWVNTSIYQWNPDQPLAGSTTYTAVVTAGLEDQAGSLLQDDFSWQFATLPPEIVSVEPGFIDNVPLDTGVTIEFNQPMNRASVEGAFSLSEGIRPVAASAFEWSEDSRRVTATFNGLLSYGTEYTASVGPGAKSATGDAGLSAPQGWSFTTANSPAVVSVYPLDGSRAVETWEGISIKFTAEMDKDTLEDRLITDPALPKGAVFYYNTYDYSWNVSAAFEPSTTYLVTLLPGSADLYGTQITEPVSFSFTTAPLSPEVRLNVDDMFGVYSTTRPTELFLRHRNISRIDFTLSRLSFDQFMRFSEDYTSYINYQSPVSEIVRQWSISAQAQLNESVYKRVPLVGSEGARLDPGIYMLVVDAPEVDGDLRHIMLVNSANLTLKSSFGETLAWLTDFQNGQPITGATVTIYDAGRSVRAEGITDRSGVVELAHNRVEDLWQYAYAIVNRGNVFAVARSDWARGIEPWTFGNIDTRYFDQNLTMYLYTDRPIYRPGQDVFFKGIVRGKDDMTYTLPRQQVVDVSIFNSMGDVVYADTLPVNEMGTFDGAFRIGDEAEIGYYTYSASIPDVYNMTIGFQVAEYRKPEFQVAVTASQDEVVAGDEIVITVDAQFFSGGPVSDAEVSWSVLSSEYAFNYTGQGNYSFMDIEEMPFYYPGYSPGFGDVVSEGVDTTDGQGKLLLRVPADLSGEGSSRMFTIEAVVRDINEQTVAGRVNVVVHKGQYYAGVAPESYVTTAGDTTNVNLVVVDWQSEPVARRDVDVDLIKVEWNSVQQEDEFGQVQWVWDVTESVAASTTVTTDASGKARASFVPLEGGSYKIRATVADDGNNTQRSASYLWVSSSDYVSWRQGNDNRIDLVADRDSYKPGDVAELLIASPFQGSNVRALVTVERGSIISHEVITLDSNSHIYRLPVTGQYAPNIFVSVVIVKGVDETSPLPDFRMGLVNLKVEPVEQTITVTLTPSADMVGPREQVTYTVEASDFRGQPVDAEISLSLVDLATLSLAPSNTQPILDAFYGLQGLGVSTSVPLSLLVDRITQELIDEGKGGGGGGGEAFFDIRSEFEDTAFWSATVRTGDDGVETVSILLPDNLTTWRMDARAVTTGTLVGSSTIDVVATKPLLIRPQTPRFFVVADQAVVSAVVQNNTGTDVSARVSLSATGATVSNPEQVVSVPDGGRVLVTWPLVAGDGDWVDLVFAVEGGGYNDASRPPLGDANNEQKLPVYRYEVVETVGTAGFLAGQETRIEGVALPPTMTVQAGQVDVQIDPSLAASTLDALTWLEHYPYECAEQTISRFLPNALTLIALREFGITNPELETSLQQQMSVGIQRLYAQQHVDGGWGWFVSDESDVMVSAYAVQGLLAAKAVGFTIEDRVLDSGISYLQNSLSDLSLISASWGLDRQVYVLYVLAQAGQPDISRTVNMYEGRLNLQHYSRALLAQTMWMINPDDGRLLTLQSDLISSALISATGVHWEEAYDDRSGWNTDTRSTAIILDTFAKIWPGNEFGANAVRWLMVARKGGHWETTQETVWALMGLTDWMVATGELDANYNWTFEFNGQSWANGQASAATINQPSHITIDVTQLLTSDVNRLVFARTEGSGRMYYTAHLSAYLPVEEVQPLNRGIAVSRRYLDANGTPVNGASVGDTITVELTIVARNDVYYLVVEDPYPAGAEAIDTSLLTESVREEPPLLKYNDPLAWGWGWWLFSQTQLRDEKAVLYADYLPAGTYTYTYQLRMGFSGTYRVIPPTAFEFYFPEVSGRGAGMLFTIEK